MRLTAVRIGFCFYLLSIGNFATGQITLATFKRYMVLSPSSLDQILSEKGFQFEHSTKNEDNAGKRYEWDKNKNTASYQIFTWGWIKADTVSTFMEKTGIYEGYADCCFRRLAHQSFNPIAYNSVLAELSRNALFDREDNSDESGINTTFYSKKYEVKVSKYRASDHTPLIYLIIVKENVAVPYQIHHIDGSITKIKSVDLGD